MSDDTPVEKPTVKVLFSDPRLRKMAAELLASDMAALMMVKLSQKQYYKNELATEIHESSTTVAHHLNKMIELNWVRQEIKPINRKTKDHIFYELVTPIVTFVINETKEEATEKKTLKKIFKSGVKYVSIVIAFLMSWSFERVRTNTSEFDDLVTGGKIPQPNEMGNLVIPLVIVIIGLIIIIIKKSR